MEVGNGKKGKKFLHIQRTAVARIGDICKASCEARKELRELALNFKQRSFQLPDQEVNKTSKAQN